MNIFFTSDNHFSHQNIIKYCNRPFETVEEMNETMFSNFNSIVKKNDMVFCLGDFSFKNPKEYLDKLNGNWFLIQGNHDSNQAKHHFGWVKDTYLLKNVLPNFHIFMSHYGHRVWPHSHHGSLHLYGHSHKMLEQYGRSFDVGVDTNNFYPYSIDEVLEKASNMKPTTLHGPDPLKNYSK